MRFLLILILLSCGRAPPATLSDACYEVAAVLCDREQQCGLSSGTVGDCRARGVQSCCTGTDCSTPVVECKSGTTCCVDSNCSRVGADLKTVQAKIDNCSAALRELTCGQLSAGLQPTACAGGI